MGQPNCAVGFIHMLAALAGSTKGFEIALREQFFILQRRFKLGHGRKKMLYSSMAFRWLITDIDGTLLDDAGELPPENRLALEKCRELGIPVVLATGRRWTTLNRLLDRLSLHGLADFAIFNNGMVVKDLRTRQPLHLETFTMETAWAAIDVLAALNIDPLALTYAPLGGPDVFHRRLSLMNGDFVSKNSAFSREVKDFHELSDIGGLVELILLGHEPELNLAQSALAKLGRLETALIRNSFYAGYMLEVTPRHVSKYSGALRIADILKLDLSEAVAIGDSPNDLPLLRKVGKAVAVQNASDDVKASAHDIVSDAASGGLAEAIRRYLVVD